jgi:hypothetical protein
MRNAAAATAVGAAGLSARAQESAAPAPTQKAKVVLVRDAKVLDSAGKPDGEVLQRMLDDAVKELLGEQDVPAAWKRLVRPNDTVGIKTNRWEFLRTPEELEAAIKRRVLEAGVPENRVSIDDQGIRSNPIFQQATALINVRPMRTHHWAGVGSLLKNYILFSDSPSSWHPDSCANLAGVWDLPACKGKTRLNCLVMLTPLFHGKGPHHFQKQYTWEYKGLIVGTDPVAADATGLRILEAKRLAFFGQGQPFAVSPKHIRVAEEKFRLGVADPARIEIRKLGWTDDILV